MFPRLEAPGRPRAARSVTSAACFTSPSAGLPSTSNQRFTPARSPFPAACGRSSGMGQMRSSIGSRCVFTYVNANSMACDGGGTRQCSNAGSRSKNAFIKAARSLSTPNSTNRAWIRASFREQPWFAAQAIDEGCQVAVAHRVIHLLLDISLPGSRRIGVVEKIGLVRDEVLDKPAGAPGPAVDPGFPSRHRARLPDPTVAPLRSRARRVGTHSKNASFTAARWLPICGQTCANAIDISERGLELEQLRGKRPLRWKSSMSPFLRGALTRSSHTGGATIAPASSRISAHARRVKCSSRGTDRRAVAIGRGSDTKQSAAVSCLPPRQERRVLRYQLPQTFDVIAMDDAAGLGYGPR